VRVLVSDRDRRRNSSVLAALPRRLGRPPGSAHPRRRARRGPCCAPVRTRMGSPCRSGPGRRV